MASHLERFEAIGELFFAATGLLRPGKDVPAELYTESGETFRRERFEQWLATQAFIDALDRIVALERRIAELENA